MPGQKNPNTVRGKLTIAGYVQVGTYDKPETACVGDKIYLHDIGENEQVFTVTQVKRKAFAEGNKPGYGYKFDKVFAGRVPGPYAFSEAFLYRKK